MPIQEIERQLAERGILGNFTRVGKLRKGDAKPASGNKPGPDLNYFRMTLEPQHEYLRAAFVEQYGEQPTEFRNVFLAADTADQAFQYFYESWAHARLVRRCDGVMIGVEFAGDRYDTTPHACTCNPNKRECGLHGRLDVVLPEFNAITGVLGKFTIETHSIYDVVALRSCMLVAGALANNLPNTAFWSIPFRVGRAMKTVPVTINGQRSLKAMSLLYIGIEPEFNQKVISPRLTAPTQKLLAGVNPETGEIPEVEFEQPQAWDREYVNAQTLHLFDHENHQTHAIDGMIDAGIITDEMTDTEVLDVIAVVRAQRDTEKAAGNTAKSSEKASKRNAAKQQAQTGADWLKDTKRLNGFLDKAHHDLGMNMENLMDALQTASEPATLESVQDFTGSDLEAWAACVAWKYGYSGADLCEDYAEDSKVRQAALIIIAARAERLADIPF